MFDNIIKGKFKGKQILKHVTLDGVRIHLNTQENILWINGFYMLKLNDTAIFMLGSFIDSCYETSRENIINLTLTKLEKRYKASRQVLGQDLEQLIGIINKFSKNEIPTNLVGVAPVRTEEKKVPHRADISLTYNCNNRCPHCYLPTNTDPINPLSLDEWKKVVDKLWALGIPQLVFTGGECTLKQDNLVEIVEYAKQFITGIISNGTLITRKMANDLAGAEIDWVQITLNSHKEATHDVMEGRKGAYKQTIQGIKNCVEAGIDTNINMTLTKKNYKDLIKVIDLCKSLGVSVVSTNALINSGRGTAARFNDGIPEKNLSNILEKARKYAKKIGIGFNWFLPTCYKNFNPIESGFGPRSCSACSINIMIEPNGDVIPCQSWTHEKLGNILKDDWSSIWNNPLAIKIRSHGFANAQCRSCNYFNQCFGGCPLELINKGCKLR